MESTALYSVVAKSWSSGAALEPLKISLAGRTVTYRRSGIFAGSILLCVMCIVQRRYSSPYEEERSPSPRGQ